jgi:glutathione synthase/RimK-type ligase-like ATP-grasp enzyme
MKNVLILVDKVGPNSKRLIRFLNKNSTQKYKAHLNAFSDLFFEIKTGKVCIKSKGQDIAKYDLVFIRKAGKYVRSIGALTTYLDNKKVDFVDPAYREMGMSLDKATSAVRLAIKKIPIPDTYFCYSESILENRKKIIKGLGFPIIAKAVFSQRNLEVYILRNENDFNELLVSPKKEFVFQKFIDIKSEFRLLVMGQEVRVLEQKFERNYENVKVCVRNADGDSIFLNLNSASSLINRISLKAVKLLGLDIAGVDIAIEKESHKVYIIEVNKGPGIVYDSKISPELKAFSDYLLKRTKD